MTKKDELSDFMLDKHLKKEDEQSKKTGEGETEEEKVADLKREQQKIDETGHRKDETLALIRQAVYIMVKIPILIMFFGLIVFLLFKAVPPAILMIRRFFIVLLMGK